MTPARDLAEAIGRREAYLEGCGLRAPYHAVSVENAAKKFPAPACDPITRTLWWVHDVQDHSDRLHHVKQHPLPSECRQIFVQVMELPDPMPEVVGPSGTSYRVHPLHGVEACFGASWSKMLSLDLRDVHVVAALLAP